MNEKKIWKIILISFLLLLTVSIFYGLWKKQELNVNADYCTGVLIDVERVGNTFRYEYSYEVDGKKYTASNRLNKNLTGCPYSSNCLGRKFKVKYSQNNPENSEILLDQEVYE